jgi:hypothetical protein
MRHGNGRGFFPREACDQLGRALARLHAFIDARGGADER